MKYLDERPGEFFSVRQLHEVFKDSMNYAAVNRCMGIILKRPEYIAVFKKTSKGVRASLCYGVKKHE